MEANARLYNCAKCHSQVIICSRCDRGNIYCPTCSQSARSQSLKAAGQRYQKTTAGRHKHAERQKRYRERLRNKVTHQGSPLLPSNDLLPKLPYEHKNGVAEQIICHFCGNNCSGFMRYRFLSKRINANSRNFAPRTSG